MNILVCPDKFKFSFSANDFCRIAEEVLGKNHALSLIPMADGGEGTLDILVGFSQYKKIWVDTLDPLERPLKAFYLLNDVEAEAHIELAQASGLQLLSEKERNPLKTNTFGTGLIIRDALERGVKKITLWVGGSATNDAGLGLARSLGFQFFDGERKELEGNGGNLAHVKSIIPSDYLEKFTGLKFEIATDVKNPLFGEKGAAYIYAPQKGANNEMVRYLDKGLNNIHLLFMQNGGKNLSQLPGAGAAGGVGAGAVYFLNAKIVSGAEKFLSLANLKQKIAWADCIITGEGKIDQQTFFGKMISEIIHQSQHKNLFIIAGTKEENLPLPENVSIFTLESLAKNHEDSIQNGLFYLKKILGKFV